MPSLPHPLPARPQRLNIRIEYKQGWVYEGETVDGVREGRGRMVWPSGDSYEGMFSGGRANGEGCFRLVTGETYSGQFCDDQIVQGTRLSADGKQIYCGQFSRHSFEGFGKLVQVGAF
jgi:hypothetical protein